MAYFIPSGYLQSVGNEDRPQPLRDPYGIARTHYNHCNEKLINPIIGPMKPCTVELRNVARNTSTTDIKHFFRPLYIDERNITVTDGKAWIRFNERSEMLRALSFDKRILRGHRIYVTLTIDDNPKYNREDNNGKTGSQVTPSNKFLHSTPTYSAPQIKRRKFIHHLKGLPQSKCNETYVRQLCQPIPVKEVVFETESNRKPTANAFVEFDNRIDYDLALHLITKRMKSMEESKENMSENMATEHYNNSRQNCCFNQSITAAKTDEMVTADRQPNDNSISGQINYCVKVDGFPATVTNEYLTDYFSKCGAHPYCIHSKLASNAQNCGEAYVEFSSRKCHDMSLAKDGDYIQNWRISVKPIAFEAMRNIVQKRAPINPHITNHKNVLPSILNVEHLMDKQRASDQNLNRQTLRKTNAQLCDGRVVIAFIPYNIKGPSIQDICQFFFGYGINERCVSRKLSDNGRQKADVSITFKSKEHARDAVKRLHKKFLWGKPVHLRQVN